MLLPWGVATPLLPLVPLLACANAPRTRRNTIVATAVAAAVIWRLVGEIA